MVALHLACIFVTGLAVLYSDEQALMWVLGKQRTIAPRLVDTLHIIVSIGLATIIATGGLMFLGGASYYLHEPIFITKMVFVGALIINGFLIDRLSVTATEKPFSELSHVQRAPLLISGAVSLTGWVGAGLCGLLLA